MDQQDEINPDELEDFTPDAIANTLFHQEPKDPFTCRLLANPEEVDSIYLFELLITILMEGLDIMIGGLSTADLSNMTTDHITCLNPWFYSLGFKINIELFDRNENEDEINEYQEYYCKTVIRNKVNEIIFEKNNVDKDYHFFINGHFLKKNQLKENLRDLYSVFINGNDVFKISFDFYVPNTVHTKLL